MPCTAAFHLTVAERRVLNLLHFVCTRSGYSQC